MYCGWLFPGSGGSLSLGLTWREGELTKPFPMDETPNRVGGTRTQDTAGGEGVVAERSFLLGAREQGHVNRGTR